MGWSPEQWGVEVERARSADTVIFVDVDGVLNVGARDDGDSPLLLNDDGVEDALKLWGKHKSHSMRHTIERLVSIAQRELSFGENATYTSLACSGNSSVSSVLVARLAKLILAAGKNRLVVLSSKWEKYRQRVKRLEAEIAGYLGLPFVFDGKTGPDEACTPEFRLQAVGRFLEGLCGWRQKLEGTRLRLRVLMLEDFHISAMDGWSCDGQSMDSVAAAEQYLRERMPPQGDISLRLVHTYDEWSTTEGLLVQVGCGLCMQHFSRAAEFLGMSEPPAPKLDNDNNKDKNSTTTTEDKADCRGTKRSAEDKDMAPGAREAKVVKPMPRRKACKPAPTLLFTAPVLLDLAQ